MNAKPGHKSQAMHPRRLWTKIIATCLAMAVVAIAALYGLSFSHIRSARTARRNDAYAQAERHLTACWRLPGLTAGWNLEYDLLGVQQGDLTAEKTWQSRATPANPRATLILEALAKGNLAAFNYNQARNHSQAILDRDPDDAQALGIRGRAWAKLQQEPKALDDFERALEIDPSAAEIRLALADLLFKLGHVRQADEHYRRLLSELPDDERVIIALARCRQDESQFKDAVRMLDELLRDRPTLVPAQVERARLELRAGRPQPAEQLVRLALQQQPDHTDACFLLQLCLTAQQRTDEPFSARVRDSEAQQVAVRLKIQDAPRDPELLTEQGRWVMRAGDWREAAGWFYLGLAENPSYAPAHEALADYFAIAHQPRRATHHARQAGRHASRPAPAFSPKPSTLAHTVPPALPSSHNEASTQDVHRLCAACHAYPPPESFPRAAWRKEVKQGYDLLRDSPLGGEHPPLESVVLYYERRAPERLPQLKNPSPGDKAEFHFEPLRTGWLANVPPYPGIANLHLANLLGDDKLELLATDSRLSRILLMRPYGQAAEGEILPQILAPCHTAVADLDADGRQDIVVACLGQFYPTDAKVGSVQWLRANAGGKFEVHTILENVGRVSDVQVADFNADGKLDLVVAAFGWRRTGAILYLENQTTDWLQPRFETHEIDSRHGAIHVPVADLNGDGRPDFVALLSQEHESVVAYLNEGESAFRPETIFVAPHPAYGSSGIELADLDSDGDLDVLLTNGDVLDRPYLLKTYHGIQWLENQGTFPFQHHALAPMYGASRAVAADFDNDQDLDIIAVSFLPRLEFPQREALDLPSIVLLEQTTRGQFATHVLESRACDHFTVAAGDWDSDGDADFAVGNFSWKQSQPMSDAAVLWFNRQQK